MAKPDARLHAPNPTYLRELLEQAGLSQSEAARRLGISDRTMRMYLAYADRQDGQGKVVRRVECPYAVQYALEQLASGAKAPNGVDSPKSD